MSIRRNVDRELVAVRSLLLRMADLVEEQFANAVDALFRRDLDAAAAVHRRDDEVDALELEVDHFCERVLALHHPVADELRILLTAIKINTDLERIGDHCKNVAKNVPHVAEAPEALAATRLREMSDAARALFRDVYDAFVTRDAAAARAVLARDEQVDRLHRENFDALVAHARQHPEQVAAVAHLLTAGKDVERVADHVANIAESVIFLLEGLDVRHGGAPSSPAETASSGDGAPRR
ncbi:MAG: phosphate signaling complex protein PhoU [Rubricoccaceae bacterium]